VIDREEREKYFYLILVIFLGLFIIVGAVKAISSRVYRNDNYICI